MGKIIDVGSNILSTLSGETSIEAGEAAAQGTREAQAILAAQTAKAREDILNLFPTQTGALQEGFQGALDVFGQSLPAQQQLFQQGNVGAQAQLLAGLPQIQKAILGGNVDLSALQPTQLTLPNQSFFQQTLPELAAPLQPPSEKVASGGIANIQNALGGRPTGSLGGLGLGLGRGGGGRSGGRLRLR